VSTEEFIAHCATNWFINLPEPLRFTVFSTDVVSGVKNFKNTCSGFFCYVCGLVSPSSWLVFVVFNLRTDPGLFSSPVVHF
jgi:hypothetical protein